MRRCLLFLIPALTFAAETNGANAIRKKTVSEHKTTLSANYKESGSPAAPIVIEEYADYECPLCRVTATDLLPQIVNEYVRTGKVRFIHRDFPLSMHPFARQAALFADAAGELGYYDLVSGQIFRTQNDWSQNGNIDAQVAKVLPPGAMQQVREMVKSDPRLEESIKKDVAMGTDVDHLNGTPTFIIVKNGNRQAIPVLPFSVMKTYIDRVMAQK